MDKYWSRCRTDVTKFILATMCVLLSGGLSATAQTSDWSFQKHPHPLDSELTSEEFFWREGPLTADTIIAHCEDKLNAYFQVYQNRYPEFGKTGDPETNFRDWKFHYATPVQGRTVSCILSEPYDRLYSLTDPSLVEDFYFCGVYSRAPVSNLEIEVAGIVDELFTYAKAGLQSANVELLISDMEKGLFSFNPDVEYYFRLLMISANARDERLTEIDHLMPLLSGERRAFVDLAAENLDLQAVLDTTQPCPRR